MKLYPTRSSSGWRLWPFLSITVVSLSAQTPIDKVDNPGPNSPTEPLAGKMSVKKAVQFLDRASLHWQQSRECVTCHTNDAYLMSRPFVLSTGEAHDRVRRFVEQYVLGWSKEKPSVEGIVATASALAINDSAIGRLSPATRSAFDEAWKLQREDGSWDWLKCGWGPFEADDHYGVTLAAIAVSVAPENYARSNVARTGLARLEEYLKNNPPGLPHQKAMMLWAGSLLPDLVSREQKEQWQDDLLGLQLADGSWATAALGDWKRKDGSPQTLDQGDGYGTGFVVFALRKSGLPSDQRELQRAIGWLKTHQRESGRWFTRSPYRDGRHYISHAGTAFALLALRECGALD